jgi:hypothetical protein
MPVNSVRRLRSDAFPLLKLSQVDEMRSAIAIGVGLLVGMLTISVIEAIGMALYPLPAGVDRHDPASLETVIASLPPGSFVFVLLAWALGAMHGGGFAAYLSRGPRVLHGLIVGAILMACGIYQLVVIPHPTWFAITGVLLFLPCAFVGALIGTQPLPGNREGWIVKEIPNYSGT